MEGDINENKEKGHPESFSNVYGVSNSCGLEGGGVEEIDDMDQKKKIKKNQHKL